MQDISKIMDSYSKADIGYERIQEIFGNVNEMRDVPGAKPLRLTAGRIDFDHVSFPTRTTARSSTTSPCT